MDYNSLYSRTGPMQERRVGGHIVKKTTRIHAVDRNEEKHKFLWLPSSAPQKRNIWLKRVSEPSVC